jgi:hypothetical protein
MSGSGHETAASGTGGGAGEAVRPRVLVFFDYT